MIQSPIVHQHLVLPYFLVLAILIGIQWDLIAVIYILLLLFSRKVISNSLWPHGIQQTRLQCPPLCPGVWSRLCPLIWWCYLTSHPLWTLFLLLSFLVLQGSFLLVFIRIITNLHLHQQQETSVFSLLSPSGSVCRLFEEVSSDWCELSLWWFDFLFTNHH